MTEKQIKALLKGQSLNRQALYLKADALTATDKASVDALLDHMVNEGILGFHNDLFFLLESQGLVLGRVFMKKKNFVVLSAVPAGFEMKLSGEEAEGLLIGDLVYMKQISGNYHAVDYLKPVTSFTGRFSMTAKGKNQLLVDYLNQCGKTVIIDGFADGLDIHQGDLIRCDIEALSGNTYTVKATELLVRASDVGSDIAMIIRGNDAPMTFPEEVLAQAKALESDPSADEMADRMDLRDELIVTIDGDDAHDFDDAVSIRRAGNGFEAIVSIADVTHYVRPNSPLDDEALARGTSIYVADRVVPMLPFELSNGICSLNPDKDRLALSVIMELDAVGNVFSSKIVRSVIHSHARLTYKQVNQHFRYQDVHLREEKDNVPEEERTKDADLDKAVLGMLDVLRECADRIRTRRVRQGALELSSTELKFKLDENGEPTEVIKQEPGIAERMIEDYMIIANCEVAKQLKNHKVPVLYRVHEFPKTEKINDFKDFVKKMDPKLMSFFPRVKDLSGARLNGFLAQISDKGLKEVISYMMLRALAKARYTPEELGHFGLAEPYYCHFTSPIRRYPDDIIHRLVKDYIIDGKPFDAEDVYARLERLGDLTSSEEVRADKIQRACDDLESCKYMANRIGETFHGKVTGIIQRGMFIETDIGIEGFLSFHCMHGDAFSFDEKSYSAVGKYHQGLSFSIGTEIDVTVLSVDMDQMEIDFATPQFYQRNADELTSEDRIGLSRYGIFVEREGAEYPEERDFHRFDDRRDKKTFGDRDDDRRPRFDDETPTAPEEEGISGDVNDSTEETSASDLEVVSTTGYQSRRKETTPGEDESFRRKPRRFEEDDRGFDSQARKPKGRTGSKMADKKKRPGYGDHKGYSSLEERSERRIFTDGEGRSFDRKPRGGFRRDGKRRPFSKDGGEGRSFGRKPRRSFGDGERSFSIEGGEHRSFERKPRGSFHRDGERSLERKPEGNHPKRSGERRSSFGSRGGRSYGSRGPRKDFHRNGGSDK